MKKKIVGVVIVAAMAVAAGWNFNQSKNEVELSDLALANVEALAADGESGDEFCTMHYNCYDSDGHFTGKYSASSYKGPNCKGVYHYHSCSNCNSR